MKNKLIKGGYGLVWIVIWWGIAKLINRPIYFPTPLATLQALRGLVNETYFYTSVLQTIARVLLGFSLSAVLAITLGIIAGLNQRIYQFLSPFNMTVRATPVISIIIIALVWFKSSTVPVFIAFLMCFPIIWTNVIEGLKNVDDDLLEMAQVYGINKKRRIKEIYLPSLIPYIIAGMTTALGIGWKVTVAAEVLSHPKFSIGTYLYESKVYLNTPQLFAWTLVIILLSFIFENFIKSLSTKYLMKFY
jgi:NitT/TauT family transport system permease protein